jgi:ribokinase
MMAGRVGKDTFGEAYLESFRKEGVDSSLVQVRDNVATGVAVIEVDANGENHIVVVPGANMTLDESYIHANATAITEAHVCLFQLEIPAEATRAGMELARSAGKRTILDPAPAPREPIPREILSQADYVTPNETEAQLITGVEVSDSQSAERAARALREQGAGTVIIKAGAHGAYVVDENGVRHVDGFSVKAVDTTAAGDAFNAGLAYSLGEGNDLEEAVRYANAVGALACTKLGAQSALPRREEVESLLRG